MGTLKLQINRPLYSNTVIGTLAVDGRAVTFGTAKRGLGGLRPFPEEAKDASVSECTWTLSALEALRNALYKFKTYLLTY